MDHPTHGSPYAWITLRHPALERSGTLWNALEPLRLKGFVFFRQVALNFACVRDDSRGTQTLAPPNGATETKMAKRETYTLTAAEAAIYDGGDDSRAYDLARDITALFCGTDTEVVHPEGFVWLVFSTND